MAHLGWIFPVIVYLGGILTGLYGHVGKYSLDKANELKELIVQIRLSISSFEYHPSQAKALSNYASPLRSKTWTHSVLWLDSAFAFGATAAEEEYLQGG